MPAASASRPIREPLPALKSIDPDASTTARIADGTAKILHDCTCRRSPRAVGWAARPHVGRPGRGRRLSPDGGRSPARGAALVLRAGGQSAGRPPPHGSPERRLAHGQREVERRGTDVGRQVAQVAATLDGGELLLGGTTSRGESAGEHRGRHVGVVAPRTAVTVGLGERHDDLAGVGGGASDRAAPPPAGRPPRACRPRTPRGRARSPSRDLGVAPRVVLRGPPGRRRGGRGCGHAPGDHPRPVLADVGLRGQVSGTPGSRCRAAHRRGTRPWRRRSPAACRARPACSPGVAASIAFRTEP